MRPLRVLEFVPSYVWFFAKLSVLLFVFIWIRGTLPRMRIDQVMNFAWKFMLPMAFTCIIAAAVWHYQGAAPRRLVLVARRARRRFTLRFLAFSRPGRNLRPRTYRFAE